jgi:hypothetical protein
MLKCRSKKGYHRHHIIPRHMGGSDEPENIKYVTVEEHAQEHLKLYQKYGKRHDLAAYHFLSKNIETGIAEISRMGGLVSGKMNRESGHIQRISKSISHEDRVKNGRKGSETCRKLQKNAFFDPKLRSQICKKGGKVQGKINAQSGHLKRISSDYWKKVKAGEIVRAKKIWICSKTLNITKQILASDPIPEGFEKGRILKRK